MGSSTLFKTEFAVHMTCEACVEDVRKALRRETGVESYDIDLKSQRVIVEGRVAPSKISRALKDTGRQVIVRGAGTSSDAQDAAAVCIFEAHTPPANVQPDAPSQQVHGIARFVQAGDTTLLDVTVRHHSLLPGKSEYNVYVAKNGNISDGAASTGGVLRSLGRLSVAEDDGFGELFTEIDRLKLHEVIGRALVVAPLEQAKGTEPKLGAGILAGVIARSAGLWGTSSANDKTVCSCSGQTMWEERKLMDERMANL